MDNCGILNIVPAISRLDLMVQPVADAMNKLEDKKDIGVAEINPSFSDTAAFCEKYKIDSVQTVNCVVVKAKRGDREWYAACTVLATTKADVNSLVRRHLDARRVSFASMEEAVSLTGMEYGGVTPIGLPQDWPLLVDFAVVETERIVVGSGIRKSKFVLSGKLLAELPNAVVLENLGIPRM